MTKKQTIASVVKAYDSLIDAYTASEISDEEGRKMMIIADQIYMLLEDFQKENFDAHRENKRNS